MEEFHIKSADDYDLELLYELEGLLFDAGAWSRESLRSCLHSERELALVARDGDNSPLGYLTGSLMPDGAELYRIGVLPWQRRRGVGRALAEAFFERARESGADRVLLEVRESNATAREFYGRLGFRELCRRRRYYSAPIEDAVIMEKELRVKS